MDDDERRLRRMVLWSPVGRVLLPLLRSAGPRLTWAEARRRRNARERRAEAGLPPDPALDDPPEELLRAWYGPRRRRIGSEPVDWAEEVIEPPDPDLG